MKRLASSLVLAVVLPALPALAQAPRTLAFEAASDLADAKVTGPASLDPSKGAKGGSLKVEPTAQVRWNLRGTDGSGRVRFKVYDDGSAQADPKKRHTGPLWGVADASGRLLVAGVLYAPYLSGADSYNLSEYSPSNKETPFSGVKYLGLKRPAAWREWTFEFDADKGLSILCDGKNINPGKTQRFDWNTSKVGGFAGIVILGDEGGPGAQTIWVDDLEVALGGPMNAKPVPPPPPPPVLPDKDPAVEGPAAKLRPEVAGKHPRLLFGPEDLAKLRENYASEGLKAYREAFLKYLPACLQPPTEAKFLTDATDGQRQGLWRLTTLAYHWLMTGDEASLNATVEFLKTLEKMPHWESGEELDSGMSSANVMAGAALAFDWVHDKLDPAFREAMRKKLVLMARAQYHGGHLMKAPGKTKYWQNEPANNHRWHRNAGMSLAILAAYEGSPDEDWILSKTRDELKYVADWLPEDGTSHESATYQVFGSTHLLLAMLASDRCFGSAFLEKPFFKNVGPYYVQNLTPGFTGYFYYGDSAGKPQGYLYFLDKLAALHRQADVQSALDEIARRTPNWENMAWFALLWKDPSLAGGDYRRLPTAAFHADIGQAVVRDGWETENVGLMFKCGPLGGYSLNRFRAAHNNVYINVAHDDSDANSFVLYGRGELLAETDRYSKSKKSANHNTVLVNGVGQTVQGRPEGNVFNQPGSSDMSQMAVVTAWKDAGAALVVEGEAAGAYPALAKPAARPSLERFRRAVAWVKGDYVLVLDSLKAPQEVEYTWLLQGAKLDAVDAAAGRYRLAKNAASCDVQVVSLPAFAAKVGNSPADDRGTPLGWKQLQATVKAPAVRFASVYDAWARGNLKVAQSVEGDTVKVEVEGPGFKDTWTWAAPAERFAPSPLKAERAGKGLLVEVGPKDAPPKP
jgi:hypothetical protein